MTFENLNDAALSKLSRGMETDDIINFIVIESGKYIGEGSIVSILLIDSGGLLRNGYSPQLPFDYLQAIDGIKPHPQLGTCAAAAATGEVVITSDFCGDNKWSELKHLPLAIGFRGAWSIPIKDQGEKVIGTFGVYLTEVRTPTRQEITGTQLLANTVSHILCNRNKKAAR